MLQLNRCIIQVPLLIHGEMPVTLPERRQDKLLSACIKVKHRDRDRISEVFRLVGLMVEVVSEVQWDIGVGN